jgi:hypothetical protein
MLATAARRSGTPDCQKWGDRRTKPDMAPKPDIAPVLFDRALLRAPQNRARRGGPASLFMDLWDMPTDGNDVCSSEWSGIRW